MRLKRGRATTVATVSDELAVVRRPYVPGLKPIRTGVVLAQAGDLYEVRWDDNGSEDEIRLGDYERVMPRDSLSYVAALGGLNGEFAADALPVVLRVLSESGGPVNAKVIRAYLIDLGLDKTVWSYPGALFMSAGGYHHHLGTNTWAGNGPHPKAGDARLLEWTIELPGQSDVAACARSIAAAGYDTTDDGESALVADPWGTGFRIRSVE